MCLFYLNKRVQYSLIQSSNEEYILEKGGKYKLKYKKLLTINDLVKFCEAQNFSHFSSKETGYQICVQIPTKFEQLDDSDEDMLFAPVLAFHTGANRNRSNVTESAAKKAIKELAYKPVLANFCEIDGVRDFTTHDFEMDEDGNITYLEKQIGCFTADKAYMEQDPDHDDRMNVFAKVAIPRQYTDAAEIIERKGGTDCSVELAVNEMQWDSRERSLMLTDITVMGLTCLGKNPETGEDIQPGMENAHIQLEDFSAENNSVFSHMKLIESLDKLAEQLERFNINNPADGGELKEGGNLVNNKFEELLKTYDKTAEDVEFDYENLTDEELEAKFSEVFGDPTSTENFDGEDGGDASGDGADSTSEEGGEEAGPDDEDDSGDDEGSDDEESNDDGQNDVDDTDDGVLNNGQQGPRNFSINGVNYEVSLSEIQWALCELVQNTYGESDNDYYAVEVYEGSKTVVMCGLFSGKCYRQSYKARNEVYSLTGDRVPVKQVFVTADEEAELDRMRSNYAEISEKLQKYESEPEKMEILNSTDYANIADQADFADLKKQENHFDLSIDELKNKADEMLLQYAKSGKLNFAATEPAKKEQPKKDFFAFAKVERESDFLDGLLKSRK